jgi:hypothetical protein
MKQFVKLAALVMMLAIAVTAFAGDRSMKFSSNLTVNGTTIPAGEYKVRCTVNGTSAEVLFMQGKKTVATATGQVVQTAKAAPGDSIITDGQANGTARLVALQFANQSQQVRFISGASGGN